MVHNLEGEDTLSALNSPLNSVFPNRMRIKAFGMLTQDGRLVAAILQQWSTFLIGLSRLP
jgi:hypothetical protein